MVYLRTAIAAKINPSNGSDFIPLEDGSKFSVANLLVPGFIPLNNRVKYNNFISIYQNTNIDA